LLVVSGCTEEEGLQPPGCTPAEETAPDSLVAQVDGDEWLGDLTLFQVGPTGMMIGFTADATNAMTIRLQRSSVFVVNEEDEQVLVEDGDGIEEIYEQEAVPADFSIGDSGQDGADVTLVLEGETLHSSDADDEGFLRLAEFHEDEDSGARSLLGCGWFDAETQDHSLAGSVQEISFSVALD